MTKKLPPPPDGFTSWLDYTVLSETFSGLRSHYLFDGDFDPLDTEGLQALVRAEYAALKARAVTK